MMENGKNGWLNSVVPAMLLALPVGSVYAFSYIAEQLASACAVGISQIQWAFSLSIFFLGLGAAFFGKLVEKNPAKAAATAAGLFASGTAIAGYGVQTGSFPLVLLGYGFLNGLGQGVGYLAPVKTLMLWFPKRKALAASISITAFGLGSSLYAWLAGRFAKSMPFECFFYTVAIAYSLSMLVGSFLLAKPKIAAIVEKQKTGTFKFGSALKSRFFWQSWAFMFLSIAPGLALIGCAAGIFQDAGFSYTGTLALLVACGIANGSFRVVSAWLSDMAKPRALAWVWLACASAAAAVLAGVEFALAGLAAVALNACYGGAFATCPAMVADCVDPRHVSRIHGMVLTAWAAAGLVGNKLAMHVHDSTGSFRWLFWFLAGAYALNAVNAWSLLRWQKKQKASAAKLPGEDL